MNSKFGMVEHEELEAEMGNVQVEKLKSCFQIIHF